MICAYIYIEFLSDIFGADNALDRLAKQIGAAAPKTHFCIVKIDDTDVNVKGLLMIDHPFDTIREVLADFHKGYTEDLFFHPICETMSQVWGKPMQKYYFK